VRNGLASVFRVRVVSSYHFKVISWKTRHREVNVAGDVEVGEDGKNIVEKEIQLTYVAAVRGCYVLV